MKTKGFFKELIERIVKILKYISKGLIFVVIGIMVVIPFAIKKITFSGDDLVLFDKPISVLAVEGKASVKVLDSYIGTNINYDEYNTFIKSYNKSGSFKKVVTFELFMLFLLFEFIAMYYIIVNIVKLFVDKEEDEYNIYVLKKSFVINVISVLVFSLIRRFLFRNTIFASLNLSSVLVYSFSILMFLVVNQIINMNKVSLLKVKKK